MKTSNAMLRRLLHWTGALAVCLAGIPRLSAQVTPETMPQRGLLPYGSHALSELETINVVNGNIVFRQPLAQLPPGRAGWTAGVNLTYNSQIYDIFLEPWTSQVSPGTQTLRHNLGASRAGGGWQYGYMYSMDLQLRMNPAGVYDCNGTPDNWKIYKLSVISPDGSHHTLHLYPNTPSNPPGHAYWDENGDGYYEVAPGGTGLSCPATRPAIGDLTYYTTDGTYLKVVFSASGGPSWTNRQWTIYFPDGRTATGYGAQMTSMKDRNGNSVNVYNYASPNFPYFTTSTVLSDDLGRSITIQYNPDIFNHTQDTIAQAGYSEGGTPRTLTWTVNWGFLWLYNSPLGYLCTTLGDSCAANMSQMVVTSVLLPTPQDGVPQSYAFFYADNSVPGWGELNHVTLPSGATVHYSYAEDGVYKANIHYLAENPVSQKVLTWVDDADSSQRTETSHYAFGPVESQITNPDGGIVRNYYYDPHMPSNPKAGFVFKTRQPDGSTIERAWDWNRPYGSQGIDLANPYVRFEFRTVANGGQPIWAVPSAFTYDANGNLTQAAEYDWISYAGITRDAAGAPTGFTGSSLVRTTSKAYSVFTSPGNGADQNAAYWHPGSPNVRSLLTSSITSGVGPGSNSSFTYYDQYGHPNLTQERHWDSATGTWATTNYTYDSYGNRLSVQNPRGYATTFEYTTANCLWRKVQAAQTADARTFTYDCDSNLGLVTRETDTNQGITRHFDYDRFGRNTLIHETGGNPVVARLKRTSYFDGSRYILVQSDLNTLNDGSILQNTWFDRLGRVRQSSDRFGNKVQTRYMTPALSGSSYQLASNPHATGAEDTMGWTRTRFDTNGRVVDVQRFAGAGLPYPWGGNGNSTGLSTTAYALNQTTTTDETGVSRTQYTDALGRLAAVSENGIAANTFYSYDALDNLTGVTPASGNGRGFTYSSLSRLLTANNPESGVTSYAYDPNGNLSTRVSGGVTTTYGYNALDQITAKTYNDGTPAVSYAYSAGRRISATSGTNVYQSNTFDGLGRITNASQTTNGVTYTFQYTYNLADQIRTMQMPSGRVITTNYDAGGRTVSVTGQMGGGSPTTYATVTSYTPGGAAQDMTLGSTLVEKRCFNARMEMTVLRQRPANSPKDCSPSGMLADASDRGYLRNTYANGNVMGQTIQYGASGSYGLKSFQQSFSYDGANRLLTATETGPGAGWSQGFGYDKVGNRWVSSGAYIDPFTPLSSGAFNSSNRMIGSGAQYDGAGNQTVIGGYQFAYDAENRMKSSTFGAATTYSYDADGRRVMKVSGGVTTVFVYDIQGQMAAEYTVTGTPPASPCTGTCYMMADHLGSTRMLTDSSGQQKVLYDYFPFGESLVNGDTGRDARWGAAGGGMRFTGKEQEGAEGDYFHYFGARYFSGGQGRFTSPDPLGAGAGREEDPQSWNLYAYARNNPLLYSDPDGLRFRICNIDGNCFDEYADEDFYKNFTSKQAKKEGITFKGNKILKDGKQIGTWQRLSFDDLSPTGNAFFSGMSARREASNQFIGAFAAASVVAGAGVGIGLQATGGTLTTLESASPYFRFSAGELNQLIGGAQRELLRNFFGQGQQGALSRLQNLRIPEGLGRRTLEIYKGVAERVVQRGPGAPGYEVQKLRLELVEKALSTLK